MARRLLFVMLWLTTFYSFPAFGLWKTLKTEAFIVFYPSGRESEAREILEVLERCRAYVRELVGGRTRHTAVVLQDVGTESNGLTDVIYRRILLFQAPPSEGELGYYQNWWRLVGVHEYTHWQHLGSRQGLPALLAAVFGNHLSPGNFTPSWLKEGICVLAESGLSPYEGRLNEGFFDAYTAILAQAESLPSIVQVTYNLDTFPAGTGPYLFGGEFLRFLAQKYGRRKLERFFLHYSASVLSYLSPALPALGLDRSTRKIFGESIQSLWLQWQLQAMKNSISFRSPGEAVTDAGWLFANPVIWEGKLYCQRSYPLKPAPFSMDWRHELVRLDPDTGERTVLVRSPAPFTASLRIQSGLLYYAVQELEGGHENTELNRFGVTSVLYTFDLSVRRRRPLLKEPFRAFEVLEDGTILTAQDRPDAFGSEIRIYDPEAGGSRPLFTSDLLVGEIAAGDGVLLLSARPDWDNFHLYRVQLSGWDGNGGSLRRMQARQIRPVPLHDTPFREAGLCLAGDRLFYSANYGGHRTVYEHNLSSGAVLRAAGSDYAATPAWDGERELLYYVGLNVRGYDLYREKHFGQPITVPAGSYEKAPAAVSQPPLPESAIQRGGYLDNLASLAPRGLFPLFTLDPIRPAYRAGATLAGVSALGDLRYLASGYYDSVSRLPVAELTLQSMVLAPLISALYFTTPGARTSDVYTLSAALEWPLYRSLRAGLSHFSLGLNGSRAWSEPESWGLEPYFGTGLQASGLVLDLRLGFPWERVYGDSYYLDAYALTAGLNASLALLGAGLSTRVVGLYDLQGYSIWGLPLLRGYQERLIGSAGAMFSTALSIPLLRLRAGLWNPGIYFGDLFVVPFVEAAFNQAGELRLSYGGELHLEVRAGATDAGYPLDLSVGLAVNLEGQAAVLIDFGVHWLGDLVFDQPASGLAPEVARRARP